MTIWNEAGGTDALSTAEWSDNGGMNISMTYVTF